MTSPYLSVIIPAYREEQRIRETLQELRAFLQRQPWTWEVIVVDDGSPDRTKDAVAGFQQTTHMPIRLLVHPQNRGKGAAVRTGMLAATGTYALFTDADNATPIQEVEKLLKAVTAGYDLVIASRYLPESTIVRRQPMVRRMMSRAGNLLFTLMLGLHFTDTRCGFKLFTAAARTGIFAKQTLERFGFDTELLVIAARQGLRVAEVPVAWYDHTRSTVHPWRDSLRSLREIFHIRRMRDAGHYDANKYANHIV